MAFDSSDSRRAAEFDTFRRELVMHSKTVSGEAREAWFEKLKALVEALFPGAETNFRKPGLATRLYSAEVSLPGQDKFHLVDLCTELDDNWRALIKDEVKGGASCVYRDRLDAIWEWVVDLGNCYVSGHVKLRNFAFDPDGTNPNREYRPRPERPGGFERRPYNDRPAGGGRPPYGDRKPYGDRPQGGDRPSYGDRKPYGDRPQGGDRPSYGDRKPYGDRPQGGDRKPYGDRPPYGNRPDSAQGSDRPFRKPWTPGNTSSFGHKGPPKYGKAGPGYGRPRPNS